MKEQLEQMGRTLRVLQGLRERQASAEQVLKCTPPEVQMLGAAEQLARNQAAAARLALERRTSLQMLSPSYIPCGELEDSERVARETAAKLREQGRQILRDACNGCSDRFQCPARLQ